MKIKQTTKMIILVVALVSVIGVGAVSFAAWNGGVPSFTASASVGEVSLVGFTSGASASFDGKLIPYNQTEGTLTSDMKKVITLTIPDAVVNGNYEITVKITSANGIATSTKFYAQIGKTAVTAAPTTIDNSWTELSTNAKVLHNITNAVVGSATDSTVSGLVLSLIMDSSVKTDMNHTIELEIAINSVAITTPAPTVTD